MESLAISENQTISTFKRRQSLQGFLILVVFVSMTVPAVITGTILINENFDRNIEQDSQFAADNYADLLQAGMTMPLWNVAPSLGEPLLDIVKIDQSVLKVSVLGTENDIFLQYVKENFDRNEDTLTVQRDIMFDGERLGSVELIFSLKVARERALHESRLLLTIIVIQVVFSLALLSYFLRRRVMRPLTALEAAAAGIAGGDLKTSIPVLKNDEFGALSGQLESMRGSIEQSVTTLEERVKERTSELVDLNKELHGTLEQLQEAQGSLVQSEKLAALGSLVAGVSHELNTPIGNGLTVASSLRESTGRINHLMASGMKKSDLERYLADMDEGTHLVCASLERASELVSSFKQVAVDRTSAQRREFVLEAMLKETKLTLSPMFKHTPFVVSIDVPSEVRLNSYPGPLGQVITNLLSNALIHAFGQRDHGQISITAHTLEKGVNLYVEDDGAGISEDNLNRIFDPFFTTKLGEGGNGLGMHIVHNIVTGVLGGSISVKSQVGVGTLFEIYIPYEAPIPEDKIAEDASIHHG